LSIFVPWRALWLNKYLASLDLASLSIDPEQPFSLCIVHYICVHGCSRCNSPLLECRHDITRCGHIISQPSN
jgi:hypothetical protein